MRKNEPKTPGEKARRATLGIIARLGGCAYLAYIIYKLIKMSVEGTSGMSPAVVIATTVVMGLAAVVLIAFTIRDFFTGVKNQDYSMHKYYQDELKDKGITQNEFGEFVPAEPENGGDSEKTEADAAEEPDDTEAENEENGEPADTDEQ